MRLSKPHDPGRSCLLFTIRHHVTNKTQNAGALGRPRPAPPLVACVYPSGALAFFPGRDTAVYDRLGLREPAAGDLDQLRRFGAMRQAIERRLGVRQRACVDPATADRVLIAELRAHGFGDWRVERFQMDAGGRIFGPLAEGAWRGCAMIGYRSDRRVVQLVVEPSRPTSTTRSRDSPHRRLAVSRRRPSRTRPARISSTASP
jgi:hypothetical protein